MAIYIPILSTSPVKIKNFSVIIDTIPGMVLLLLPSYGKNFMIRSSAISEFVTLMGGYGVITLFDNYLSSLPAATLLPGWAAG